MPDDDEPDHRPSAAPAAYADPDSDLDSDLDSQIPPQHKSPSHSPLPRLTTTTSGSPVRSITQTSPPKGQGLQSPIGFGSPPQESLTNNERQLISHPQTPPNNRNRYGLHHQHGSRSPSPSPRHLPPPQAASTLYHLVGGLGLGPSSPLSPFRRQFSAPLQAVRSSSRAPSFSIASITNSRPSTGYGNGTGSGSGTFFTHVNDSHGTVHRLAIKDDDEHTNHSLHADDELSDEEDQPRVRVNTHATTATKDQDDLIQDSKDVLVERLTGLIHHLQTKEPTVTSHSVLSDVSISELHAKVDEMEAVITGKPTATKVSKMTKQHAGSSARISRKRQDESEVESEDDEKDNEDEEQQPHSPLKDMLAFASSAAAAAAPGWLARSFSGSEPSPPESRSQSPSRVSKKAHLKLTEAAEIQSSAGGDTDDMAAAAVSVTEVKVQTPQKPRDVEETERIAAEAEKLAAQLEAVLKSLETRREESNHVHALLVERAEAAAFRIVDLEKEVADLEEEISCQESELKHLRLELRAIETLVNEFLPPVEAADPELVRSIENWKADWKRLREKMTKSRQKKGKSQQQEEKADGHQGHEEGLRRNGTQKKHEQHGSGSQHQHQHEHEHGHGHQHEFHEAREAHHQTHETRETYDLSVVVEVTEESLRNGHQHQQQHHHQQLRNGNGVGLGGDGQEDAAAVAGTAAASASHAARVSRTGA
ncbi:hypothetical protein B0T20DRAFT_256862 [Sordaria brevicollis]|uniref:Uncharacterized protein n=1 Tax=Sordaria brevicollis TaxID=83679 RepID=A0AAE0PCH4_SORBR|nr:hypothetical protein B0T20DRAFT_256862 [Sordaria brevicollis]